MQDNKKTRADVLFVYGAYSLRYVYLLLLIPFYSRVLGPEGYGVVLASLALMQMIWIFVNWGFSIDGTREISIAKPDAYSDIFNKHFSARILLSAVAVVVGTVAIYYSTVLSVHWLAGVFAVLHGIVSAYNLGWYYTGTSRPRLAVKVEVFGFILSLALVLTLVREETDSTLAVSLLLLSGFVSLILAHWLIKGENTSFKLDMKAGRDLVVSTKSIFVYSSSAVLLGASSTYLLSTLSTATEVGYFGSAERLVAAGLSVMAPLGAVFIPKVTQLFNSDVPLAYRYVVRVLLGLFTIGALGLCITTFASTQIVNLIFGEAFTGSIKILQMLAVIFPFYAVTLVLSAYVLIPLHHEKLLARITIFGALVNVLFAIPLATKYGGYGMAIARVISEVTIFIALSICCYQLGIVKQLISSIKYKEAF